MQRAVRTLVLVAFYALLLDAAPTRSTTRKDAPTTVQPPSTTPPGPFTAINFMQQYGYLPAGSSDAGALFNPESEAVKRAIREVQKFGAIPQTGELDNKTLELMVTPRCGVKDVARDDDIQREQSSQPQPYGVAFSSNAARRRSKRYVKGSEGWRKRTISYFIANWTPKIGQHAVETEMHKAFQIWGDYGRLKFVRVNDPNADIIVAFGRGNHGDGYAFDGPGNILAHAFYPYEMSNFGGDIHFDDDEKWKLKLSGAFDDGVDFLSVAVHELGHSMGLAHSPEPNSVMFPYFKGYDPNPPQLGYDDIMAMYDMYILRPLPEDDIPTYLPQVPHYVPDKREEEQEDGSNENESAREDEDSSEDEEKEDGPTRSTPTFDGDYDTVDQHRSKFGKTTPSLTPLPEFTTETSAAVVIEPSTEATPTTDPCSGNYDALAVLREELFVFKDSLVWRMTKRGNIVPGYPVPIKQMFRVPVSRVDAAYERPTDGNIVIFSGAEFWVIDGNRLLEGSPRPLTALGLPRDLTKIDAIMVWGKNHRTYIFSGDQYWRYDEYARQMEPGYPIYTPERWRGIPIPLDSVMTYTDGMTYFFKGSDYWRFDNSQIKADDNYPLPAPQWWLGCPEEPLEDY